MTEYNINDELFDVVCEAALLQYIMDTNKSYPSKEETDAMFKPSKKGRRRLKRALKAKEYGKPLLVVYLQRVAIVLLVTVTVAFGVLMTNTEVRAAISNAVIKWSEKSVLFKFGGDEASLTEYEDDINSVKINYIPEGMYLADNLESDSVRKYTYFNSSNEIVEFLTIEIYYKNNSNLFVDAEENNYQETEINNKKAYYLYDDESNDGVIIIDDSYFMITVIGNLKENELMKIAENIEILK